MSVAIVTGAARGLGRALALGLAEAGWDLVVDARHADVLAKVEAELDAHGRQVRALAGDIGDAGHRRALVEAAVDLGGLDLLVNNAGALGPSPLPALAAVDPAALRSTFETNVFAPLALVQEALELLRRSRGTVVGVTSDAAVADYEGWGVYGASKAALEQLHHVLGAEEPDVTVYRFDPGDMRTQMHQDAFPGEDISDRPEPDEAARSLLELLRRRASTGRYRAADVRVAS